MAIKISNSTIIDDSRNILDVNDATVTDLYVTGIASIAGSVGFTTDISIPDNAKINFGDGDDLEIYHDGSNSYIDESGTGQLIIKSNKTNIQTHTGETCGTFAANGPVELYYDNSKKFETTGYGATVFGTFQSQGFQVSGVSTFTNNPVLIGSATSTGTASQRLQVTGGAYVSGNIGIGTTNPQSTLQIKDACAIETANTTTTTTTADQVLDTLPTGTFQTARYQVSIACTGQLITAGMTTAFTSVGSITAGAGYTEATYNNVAITGGSGNDARANIGIGLTFNLVGFTSANNLIVTTTGHGLGIGVGTIAVSFASSIPNSGFTGFAVTAGNIYYAVGVGTTTLNLYQNANGTSQVTGIGITDFAGVGNTMTKSGGVNSVTVVSPGSGYETGDTLSATLGTVGSGFQFTVSTVVKNYQSSDVMILQSVGSAATTCDFIEYSSLANHEILGSFNADISGTDARLLFTPTYRNNTIKVVRTGITV